MLQIRKVLCGDYTNLLTQCLPLPRRLRKKLESDSQPQPTKCHMPSRLLYLLPYGGTIISFHLPFKYESSLGFRSREHCLSLDKQPLEED